MPRDGHIRQQDTHCTIKVLISRYGRVFFDHTGVSKLSIELDNFRWQIHCKGLCQLPIEA